MTRVVRLKKYLLMLAVGFYFVGNSVFATDNVLQAIQINGVNDTYNIVLRSDDVTEVKKTIQAPNKMILALKGIRASKTINTIYNNTSSVDSVVVEPTGADSVKIMIQAQNVANAQVNFDSLKTPLGVLGTLQTPMKPEKEIVLSSPVSSYEPVYNDDESQDESVISLDGVGLSVVKGLKNAIKDDKINWMTTFCLFALLIASGMKLIKGKDSEIKVGLTQSLKDREIDLYRGLGLNNEISRPVLNQNEVSAPQKVSGMNYGLRAYQNGTRSPYVSSEVQRPRPAVANPTLSAPANINTLSQQSKGVNTRIQTVASSGVKTLPKSVQNVTKTPVTNAVKSKTTNIDSMKFLESMTKIYEKNGRTDLAQGLKANMKKAKGSLA